MESILGKIDRRISLFKSQIKKDELIIKTETDINVITLLKKDIDKMNVAISQLNWVIKNF